MNSREEVRARRNSACGNRFRTYFYWTFFFCLAAWNRVPRKRGLCVPHTHFEQSVRRNAARRTPPPPSFRLLVVAGIPFLEGTPYGEKTKRTEKSENEREKDRKTNELEHEGRGEEKHLLIDDALVPRKLCGSFIDARRVSERSSVRFPTGSEVNQ